MRTSLMILRTIAEALVALDWSRDWRHWPDPRCLPYVPPGRPQSRAGGR